MQTFHPRHRLTGRALRRKGADRPGLLAGLVTLAALIAPGTATAAAALQWETVVNNGDAVPGSARLFNSYSPPSVNDNALVVFRGRTRGGQQAGQPITGIFSRDMGSAQPVTTIVQRDGVVPAPNNTGATFNEFPAFARIDAGSALAATRGQSQPVWQVIDPVTGETVTRLGTAGIYATPNGGPLVTGMSGLGAVPGFQQFQVPPDATGGTAGVKFDQFPGSPAAFDSSLVAFKGNYTVDGAGQTGVFYRDVTGTAEAVTVARSGQAIPNAPGSVFGSTAPPSAAQGQIVFTGLDNEDAPTAGGIYLARVGQAGISTLVGIGETVMGATTAGGGTQLNRIGEALSFDGRRVAFWGAWGDQTRTVTLTCGGEGNAAVIAACIAQSDKDQNGNPTGTTTREVPLNQGILVKDLVTGELSLVAETGSAYEDFLFWTFSGRPPGVGGGDEGGEEDFEEPRWRSSAFIATDAGRVAFKALKPAEGTADDLMFGLFLDLGEGYNPFEVIAEGALGGIVDQEAALLPITSLAIERDGFRNGWLAISVSMASEEESWAGVYLAKVPAPEPGSLALFAGGMLLVGALRRRRAGGA